MILERISDPAAPVLTPAEVRSRLGLASGDPSDGILEAYIEAATNQLDGWTGRLGRALVEQQWLMTIDRFASDPIHIPLPPLISIDSVKYYNDAGTLQTWAADQYRVVGNKIWAVSGVSYPSTSCRADAVQIEFTAGYGETGDDVPEAIRQAICLMVSHMRSMSERNLFVSSETADGVGSTSYVVGGNAGQAIEATLQALLGGYRVYA